MLEGGRAAVGATGAPAREVGCGPRESAASMISTRSPRLAVALAALALACGPGAAPPPLPESAARGAAPDQFSADAAWGHLTALAAVGPRRAGTPGAEKARAYLVGALRDPGFEVGEQRSQIEHGGERFTTVNIVAHL